MNHITDYKRFPAGARVIYALTSLLLVALFGAQVALATHAFDHQSTDIGDTCAECLQLDRFDDGLPAVTANAGPLYSPHAPPDFGPVRCVAGKQRHARQRGPPLA